MQVMRDTQHLTFSISRVSFPIDSIVTKMKYFIKVILIFFFIKYTYNKEKFTF